MKIKNKVGRPQKLKRNIFICKLRDKDNYSLNELGRMFDTTASNIAHIVDRHWKEYVAWKSGDK